MWIALLVTVGIILTCNAGVAPIYSPSYANVYYQGSPRQDTGSQSREEVTTPPPCFDQVNPTVDPETATEPYSESVNITDLDRNQGPKKIHEAIRMSEELELTEDSILDTTELPDLEPTDAPDPDPTDPPVLKEQGIYYIYHPSGLLQRVIFASRDDLQNMEYFVNYNYQDVEPIVEPIYTYDPNTLFL